MRERQGRVDFLASTGEKGASNDRICCLLNVLGLVADMTWILLHFFMSAGCHIHPSTIHQITKTLISRPFPSSSRGSKLATSTSSSVLVQSNKPNLKGLSPFSPATSTYRCRYDGSGCTHYFLEVLHTLSHVNVWVGVEGRVWRRTWRPPD